MRLRDWYRDKRGAAAMEFGLILPFMATLLIGGVELGEGYGIDVKVTDTAHIVADLVTQNTSINNATMSSILNASSSTIAPYAASNLIVTVSEITTNASGVATVTWSDSLNGTARTVGSVVSLPSSLAGTKSISLILGEVSYAYTPGMGYTITGTVTLRDSYYLYPRNSSSVTRVNS